MKFSPFVDVALCTAFAMTVTALPPAIANAQNAAAQLQSVAKVNSLDFAGKPPFHIKMTFQMYDLDGQPSDTGTVEEWWAAPGLSKTMVAAASTKSAEAVQMDSASGIDPRERFFLDSLLGAIVHPASTSALPAALKVEEIDRDFSGVVLKCFTIAPTSDQGTGRQLFSYCAEKNSDALRFRLEGTLESTSRNQIGTFHDTEVALNAEIAYSGRVAITGEVAVMQTFDPAKSNVQLVPSATVVTAGPGSQTEGIVPGHLVNRIQPAYPAVAKAGHIAGIVVLHGVISKEGTIKNLFVVASQHRLLDAAAMEAVKQWTYQPFMLNGKPVDVDTVINVNFMFSGGV